MYPIVVLSLIAVALLALGGRKREKLEPNTYIRAPPHTTEDMLVFYDALPQTMKDAVEQERVQINQANASASSAVGGNSVEFSASEWRERVAFGAAQGVTAAYNFLYSPATSPLTESQLNTFMDNSPGFNLPGADAVNAAVRAITKAYFIDQIPGTASPPTGATGTSTPNTPANPEGASSSGGSQAPAPGLYIQLKTEFDTKKAAYDALVASASQSTNPSEDDIGRLRTMNRELATLLEQTIQALSTIQSEELGTLNSELASTMNTLEQQYAILSENSDRVETLRRIREFEETKKGASVGIYMIALLVLAMAVLVIMVFFQRTNAPATAATMSPPSMANFT